MAIQTEAQETTGPIGYLVVEFPGSKTTGEGLTRLVDLVDGGLVRILDLLFVVRDPDGTVTAVDLQDVDGDGTLDLAVFEGVSSGLLNDDDVADAGGVIAPGSSAAVLIYENLWARPLTDALRRSGAELVAAGFIPQDDVVARLDATDA